MQQIYKRDPCHVNALSEQFVNFDRKHRKNR